MLGWTKHKPESRLLGETSATQMTPPFWQKAKKNEKASWLKVKKESEKAGLELNIQNIKIVASSPIISRQIDRETMESDRFIFLGSKITADGDCSHEIKRCLLLGRRAMTNLDSILKSRGIPLPTEVCLFKAMVFSSSHVWMWELNHKESWAAKNWCFWTVVLEKTLKCPLDYKEIKPVHPKGNQAQIFIGRTDAEARAPILWPPDAESWLIGEDPDAEKDWRQEKEMTDRGWDGWMASLTQWTWVWASSGSWWWTGKPGVLQSMGLQRVRHSWATGLNHILTLNLVSLLNFIIIYLFLR